MDEPPVFSLNTRRKVGSRTGSAVLSYGLGRSRDLVVCPVHLPGGKKDIPGCEILTGFSKAQ